MDRAPEHLGRRTDVDIAVHGDVLPTLQALTPLVVAKKNAKFLEQTLKKHDKLMNMAVGAYTRKADKLVPIHPEYAASLLDKIAAKDAIFTADTGMCNVWTARYINPLGTRRLIGSYLHGSMATHCRRPLVRKPPARAGRSFPFPGMVGCPCCLASSSQQPRTGCLSKWWCSTTPPWAW